MYKFPVTKDGKEYGVSIVKESMYVAGYRVRLYEKRMFLNFTYNKLLQEELFTYREYETTYLARLADKTLYKYFTNYVISMYGISHSKEILQAENEKQFIEWDGVL